MLKNIVLVGQPNAGKTTLFNTLTHGKFKTGNYPGVTVDYHAGKVDPKLSSEPFTFYDSPGMTSLFSTSEEEKIAVNGIFNHPEFNIPDLIISVVDSTQLSKQLYLSKQLIDAGFNLVIVLTMTDTIKNQSVDPARLQEMLDVPVFIASGTDLDSVKELIKSIPSYECEATPELIYPKEMTSEQVINTYKELSEIEETVVSCKFAESLDQPQLNSSTRKIDKVALHPVLGIFSFFIIMGGLFTSVFWLAEPFMDIIDDLFATFGTVVSNLLGEGLFSSLVVDGLISGIGAVVIFLPQISILFFLMNLLEDSGYLSRAAVIIDKPLSKIGMSGRAFVPLLSGYACAIPAMMSARTLKNSKERFIALFIIPLMSCSARLPVYVILLAILTPDDKPWLGGILMLVIYSLSMIFASLVAAVIGKFHKNEQTTMFALELPSYKLPNFKTIFAQVVSQAKGYLKEAGSIIIIVSIVMWALSNFSISKQNESYQVDKIDESILGKTGHLIEPILSPMGLDWRCGVAIVASFSAREIFVGTLVQIFRIEDEENQEKIIETLENAKNKSTGLPLFNLASICSLIIFYMFALLCFPTTVVAKKEFGSWKYPLIQFFSFTGIGYILSIITFQVLK
jgi:ferrous iron transport protein B